MLCKLDRQDDLCDYFIFAMAGFCFFNSGGCIIHTLRTKARFKIDERRKRSLFAELNVSDLNILSLNIFSETIRTHFILVISKIIVKHGYSNT